MSRPFASYLVGDVEVSRAEVEKTLVIIYLVIAGVPLIIFIISSLLLLITTVTFFKSITKWCVTIFTHGIIERIFLSTINYINTTKDQTFSVELSEDQRLHRMNEKIFTRINAKRIKRSAALLFPFQAYILTLVIIDQMFMSNQSIETCTTYQETPMSDLLPARECSVKLKSISNIPISEFLNPLNAFWPVPHLLNINISSFCENSSTSPNETLLTNYHIQCTAYFFRWNNVINTLTNALQWHQITVCIIKGILCCTFSWQNSLGHSQWWLKRPMTCRLLILILLTILWTVVLVIYTLIILAFNRTLHVIQVTLTFQANAILLIPIFVIPLLLYNTITLFHWAIRTIRQKNCEQEVSLTYNRYRNILLYTEYDKNQ